MIDANLLDRTTEIDTNREHRAEQQKQQLEQKVDQKVQRLQQLQQLKLRMIDANLLDYTPTLSGSSTSTAAIVNTASPFSQDPGAELTTLFAAIMADPSDPVALATLYALLTDPSTSAATHAAFLANSKFIDAILTSLPIEVSPIVPDFDTFNEIDPISHLFFLILQLYDYLDDPELYCGEFSTSSYCSDQYDRCKDPLYISIFGDCYSQTLTLIPTSTPIPAPTLTPTITSTSPPLQELTQQPKSVLTSIQEELPLTPKAVATSTPVQDLQELYGAPLPYASKLSGMGVKEMQDAIMTGTLWA
jgi:hypothetical protein